MGLSKQIAEQLYESNRHRIKGDPRLSHHAKQPTIIRQSAKQPNKTEERFRLTFLEVWKHEGRITDYKFEDITLRLAPGLRYTPDFAVYRNPTTVDESSLRIIDFYEVKGARMEEDAIVKLKIAPKLFPHHNFWLYQWKGGIWIPQKLVYGNWD